MNSNFEIKNPKAKTVLGMYADEPIGMDHPLFMAQTQSWMDAGLLYRKGAPIRDAIQSTVNRMRSLFGDNMPDELVRTTVLLVYAEEEAKKVQSDFEAKIRDVLAIPAGGGQYKKVVTHESGEVETHTCCWAEGIESIYYGGAYKKYFGLPLPKWVQDCHPKRLSRLCKLSIAHDIPLPNRSPQSNSESQI
jgi:hypothetical protein